MTAGTGAGAEWGAHWPVVLSAAVATTMPLVYLYSTGVVLRRLEAEFGWSRAEISSGPMIIAVVGLLLAPLVGSTIDRIGPRRVGLPGAVLFCLAIAGLSLAQASIWSWWALWTVLAVIAALITPAVWSAAVTSLFTASRGMALAATLTGSGLGTIVVPIVANRLLAAGGWRGVYVGLAIIWAVLVLPLLFLCFRSARDKALPGAIGAVRPPFAAARRTMLSSRYIRLTLAACAIALVATAAVGNMVPILGSYGIDPGTAASIASVVGIGSISGRLIGGYLLDRINGNIVAGVVVAAPIGSFALLLGLPGSVPAATVAALTLGLSVGIEFDAAAYLTARHFGTLTFGTLFATLTGTLVLMGGLGPLLTNAIYDQARSYAPALWAYMPLCALSSLLFLTLGPYPPLEPAAVEEALEDAGARLE